VPQNPLPARLNGPWVSLLTLVLVVGILYTGKGVLVPMALGIVFAFILTPLVRTFDRMHLPRFAGVALTMLIALGALGGIGYVVVDQFAELSTEISQYTSSMRRKVGELRLGNDAALRQFTRTMDRVTEQFYNDPDQRKAEPVRVVPERVSPMVRLREGTAQVFEPLASAFIVFVLVTFLLGQREDLRDRFIRLIGAGNVTMTTRLMNEAAYRVSQFLLWQTLVNITFGTCIALGQYWIGVPYAALWGGITAVLRFVPYVGSVLSALMPATLAFAIFPGWAEAFQTLGLFLLLDAVTAYFVEPVVFGYRTGVSSFALLVSALFWIWVWGPVGLVLSTPLTVCLVVLGRHVPQFEFFEILFGNEPVLDPKERLYQRLLAGTPDEATDNAGRFMQDGGAQAVKIEGGVRSARIVEALVKSGVPVMGHIGWTPQSQHGMGGKVRVQGKSRDAARALLSDAIAIQQAGAFSIVLELVPEQLSGVITSRLTIPTIGIGAGPHCSGQVQVILDMLGLGDFHPKHARAYADLQGTIADATKRWMADVAAGTFPGAPETVRMDDAVLEEALGRHADDRAADSIPLAIPLDRDL